MPDLIIKNGLMLIEREIIDNRIIIIENGIITYIGKEKDIKAKKVIDAKNCFVMPGLINSHTHLSMSLFQGYADSLNYKEWMKKIREAEIKLTPSDIRIGAYLGVIEMIRSGTTAFADMYFMMDEVAEVADKTGMRASLGYGMIEGLNENSDLKLRRREEFAKKWNCKGAGRITTMYAPHSVLSCSEEFLKKVKELSQKDNNRIHIHLLETKDELEFMKKNYGMCSINYLDKIGMLENILAAHCVWVSDNDIDILKNKNVNVVHCPRSNMSLKVGVSPILPMLKKGVNVSLGTDGSASSGSLNMWDEMKMAFYLHNLKAYDVFKMATINGAKALNINSGILKEGFFADIILVEFKKPYFDIFSSLLQNASVKTTIINGKVLMENYKLIDIDEEKIIKDAKEFIRNCEF